jgi:hypothetical protein
MVRKGVEGGWGRKERSNGTNGKWARKGACGGSLRGRRGGAMDGEGEEDGEKQMVCWRVLQDLQALRSTTFGACEHQ